MLQLNEMHFQKTFKSCLKEVGGLLLFARWNRYFGFRFA